MERIDLKSPTLSDTRPEPSNPSEMPSRKRTCEAIKGENIIWLLRIARNHERNRAFPTSYPVPINDADYCGARVQKVL